MLGQLGRWLAAALVALALYQGWAWKVRRDAQAEVVAELATKAQAESERRGAIIVAAQRAAERQAEEIRAERARYARLLERINHASAANDGAACLDAAATARLRRLGPGLGSPAPRPSREKGVP